MGPSYEGSVLCLCVRVRVCEKYGIADGVRPASLVAARGRVTLKKKNKRVRNCPSKRELDQVTGGIRAPQGGTIRKTK